MVDFLILFKASDRETGVSVSINHLCKIMQANGITYRMIRYSDDQELIQVIENNADSVIMLQVPTFSDEAFEQILKMKRQTTLVVHSTIAFMQTEGEVLRRFLKFMSVKRDNFSICNPSMDEIIGFNSYLPGNVFYLPNTYFGGSGTMLTEEDLDERIHKRIGSKPKKVSVFCEFRPFKNIATQVTALAIAAQQVDLELHLIKPNNSSFVFDCIEEMTSKMPFPVVYHEKCKNEELRDIIKDMALGMQVSYTETFSYVVFEHMIQGIPSVCSSAVPYASCIPSFASPVEIAESIKSILLNDEKYRRLAKDAYYTAARVNEENIQRALNTLQELKRRSLR